MNWDSFLLGLMVVCKDKVAENQDTVEHVIEKLQTSLNT